MIQRSFIHPFTKIVLTFFSIITLTSAELYADTDWATPGENVEAGQIYIQVTHDIYPLKILDRAGIAITGLSDIDAIATAYGVYKIEKTFRMKEPPEDPDRVDLARYYTVYFRKEKGIFDLIEAFNKCNNVVFAEFVPINRSLYEPNDPRYRNQWYLPHCNLPAAWDITRGSEEIIIGIVDGGLDMAWDDIGGIRIHEDFRQNLWFNAAEDLNGDGEFDLENDANFEDDDDNGFADDFYGWDFTRNSGVPRDYWGDESGHGTLVGGIVSAITDNETGIAGAGFNCKLMYTAHYSTDEPDRIVRGYQGIEYCADMGAKIINLSWGGLSGSSRANEEVIRYAIEEKGSIIFAATGNDNYEDLEDEEQHLYPAAYPGVIGVGATDQNDRKANFSNYGDFTDLAAPGVDILSAFPVDEYDMEDGTSFSCPLVAGIGALLASVNPDITYEQMLQIMQQSSVDISELGNNDQYTGFRYRVDAGALLTAYPQYEINELTVIETEGDQDSWIEQGETFSFAFEISNQEGFNDAHNVVLHLASSSEFVEILDNDVNIGDLASGETHALSENEYLSFRVHEDVPIHYAEFEITLTSDEPWSKLFFQTLTIRHPRFLLVDDDDGEAFETFYQDDLQQRPIVHDTWDIASQEELTQEYINGYNYLIWETGNSEDPLNEAEQNLITEFLGQGGFLLLSGQYIGDRIGETEFHQNILKARHISDNSEESSLVGNDDIQISQGISLSLSGENGAENGTISPSSLEPIGGALSLLTYTNEEGEVGGLYYEGVYRLVYLGFALESVSGTGASTERGEFLERILDYFTLDSGAEILDPGLPQAFELGLPHPNPFNSVFSVQVSAPSRADFRLELIDLNGRLVSMLHFGQTVTSSSTYTWDADGLAAGIYFLHLGWAEGSITRKVALVR